MSRLVLWSLERRSDSRPIFLLTSRLTRPTSSPVSLQDSIPNRYIVVLNNSVSDVPRETKRQVVSGGGRVLYTYSRALKGYAATLSSAAIQALRSNPNVRYIEPDRMVSGGSVQNPAGWGLDRIDQRSLPLSNSFGDGRTGRGVHSM
jgi:aqualysin 1